MRLTENKLVLFCRNTPKIAGAPAQLTIFYNGSVCVYDNISPEKVYYPVS